MVDELDELDTLYSAFRSEAVGLALVAELIFPAVIFYLFVMCCDSAVSLVSKMWVGRDLLDMRPWLVRRVSASGPGRQGRICAGYERRGCHYEEKQCGASQALWWGSVCAIPAHEGGVYCSAKAPQAWSQTNTATGMPTRSRQSVQVANRLSA